MNTMSMQILTCSGAPFPSSGSGPQLEIRLEALGQSVPAGQLYSLYPAGVQLLAVT